MSAKNNPFPHGIDITKPGGLDELLSFHRANWGDMQMNANADNPPADPPADPPAGGDNPPADPPADPPAAPAGGGQTNPWGEDFDAEKAWNLVQNLRNDIQTEKTKRENAVAEAVTKATEDVKNSFTQDIAKALGLVDDTPDPAKLLETVTAERDTLTGERDTWKNTALENQIKLGVFSAATANSADPTKLLDSMSFMEKVKKFDPTADDFAAQVADVVKGAVDADKSLRVQAAAPRGGGDFKGGNRSGEHQLTREELKGMSPAEILQANKEGRLNSLRSGTTGQ